MSVDFRKRSSFALCLQRAKRQAGIQCREPAREEIPLFYRFLTVTLRYCVMLVLLRLTIEMAVGDVPLEMLQQV